jgi:hypothetical protein
MCAMDRDHGIHLEAVKHGRVGSVEALHLQEGPTACPRRSERLGSDPMRAVPIRTIISHPYLS